MFPLITPACGAPPADTAYVPVPLRFALVCTHSPCCRLTCIFTPLLISRSHCPLTSQRLHCACAGEGNNTQTEMNKIPKSPKANNLRGTVWFRVLPPLYPDRADMIN